MDRPEVSIFRTKPKGNLSKPEPGMTNQDHRDFNHWGRLPKHLIRFCNDCGAPVRWKRETPGFSPKTGKPGHSYHLTCINWGRSHWHQTGFRAIGIWWDHDPPPGVSLSDIEHHSGMGSEFPGSKDCRHFNGEEYRWREGDQEFYEPEELW